MSQRKIYTALGSNQQNIEQDSRTKYGHSLRYHSEDKNSYFRIENVINERVMK